MPDIMRNDYNQWRITEEVLKAPEYIEYEKFEQEFEKILSELTWYDRMVFDVVSSGKKISVLSRETNINYVSLWNTYKKVKEHIQSKIKNYDWFRDLIQKIINIVTFGQGKRFATWVAKLFGYKDCGCDKKTRTIKQSKNKY